MDTAVYNNLKNLDIRCILFDLDNTLIETRKADSAACAKIADVLINKYKVNLETATSICSNFLTSFRKCPENTLMGLDTWRTLLWSNALGQEFQHHAGIFKKCFYF
ncbi:uncharacterized protein LOC143196243 [Rhynchophorus ferrugineus]|uniref:uncharacterized protein LOC143196243 n=1 Tax=Rhynchophorus ferrugineus TaxID=354439 RepID=UPI003FCD4CBB